MPITFNDREEAKEYIAKKKSEGIRTILLEEGQPKIFKVKIIPGKVYQPKEIFHLTESNLGEQAELRPKVQDLVDREKRVCFAPSIDQCLNALLYIDQSSKDSISEKLKEPIQFHVYTPTNPTEAFEMEELEEYLETKEKGSLMPVNVKREKTITVYGWNSKEGKWDWE